VASDDDAPATHLFPGSFSGQAAARIEEDSNQSMSVSSNVYESDDLLSMYLGLHFPLSGSKEGVQPIMDHGSSTPIHGLRFPQRVAELLCSLKPTKSNNRALDIGCAVGGSSFELAKSFDHVEAFDFRYEYFIHIILGGGVAFSVSKYVVYLICYPIQWKLHCGCKAHSSWRTAFFQYSTGRKYF
jgi:hypothetical protein